MRIKVVTTSVAFGLAFAIAQSVKAATITFEADMNVPGYVPQDELRISDQFAESFGVTFGLDIDGDGFADSGAFPKLEQAGTYPGDLPAFNLNTIIESPRGADLARSGFKEQLGQFFLKSRIGLTSNDFDPTTGAKGRDLIINYSNPVAEASGEIWDIDGFPSNPAIQDEWWKVEALGRNYALGLDANDVVDTIISPRGVHYPNPDSLDGLPWLWSFNLDGGADIHAVRLSFIGNKKAPAGFAFNNFSNSDSASKDIPEPSFVLGLLTLGLLSTYSKHRVTQDN